MQDTRTAGDTVASDMINEPGSMWDVAAQRTERDPSHIGREFEPMENQFSTKVEVDRGRRNSLVDSKCFEAVITCTVLCNIFQMGLKADYPELNHLWDVGENIATSIFVCEMLLKIIAKKRGYFRDRSNWLDAALTILGVIDCWVLPLVPGADADLQSMSALRTLRLIRLARVSRIARKIKAIMLVLNGLYHALAMSFWVLVGLVAMMFVFAIFCTEFIGRPQEGLYPGFSTDLEIIDSQEVMSNFNPYLLFGSMSCSMFTLFSIAIGGEWSEIVRPLAIKQPVFVVVFILYCILIVFGIMNVIMAVVVDNVLEESRQLDQQVNEAKKAKKKDLLKHIQIVLNHLDVDSDGQVTYEEIKAGLAESFEFRELLQDCEFPAGWTARDFLNLLDNHGDGFLANNEFTSNLFRLMDCGDFQQLCMLQSGINQVKHLVRRSHSKLERQIEDVKEAVVRSSTAPCTTEASKLSAAAPPVCDNQLTLARAEEQLHQTCSKRSHNDFSEALIDGLTASSSAQRTIQQLTSELSLDEALQQMRDLLEHTQAILKTDSRSRATVERQRQLLTQDLHIPQAQWKAEVFECTTSTQAPIAVCPDAVFGEHDINMIKRRAYNEVEDIVEAAFATMREAVHKEFALRTQGGYTPVPSPRGGVLQATCMQMSAMINLGQERPPASRAVNEQPSDLQAGGRLKRVLYL